MRCWDREGLVSGRAHDRISFLALVYRLHLAHLYHEELIVHY